MRRRFFVDRVRNGAAEISGEDARHLTRVLRVEAGQRFEISDNREVYLAQIEMARKDRVVFHALEKLPTPPEAVHLVLCAALVKFDRFEWMIEKATELGVAEVAPFACVRSEKGLDRAAAKRLERWRRIALEASQQARRDRLPAIHEVESFEAALGRQADFRFVLDEAPGGDSLHGSLPSQRAAPDRVAILVGPEGGWTPEERAQFLAAGWTRVSLGPRILRSETAAIAALAVVASAWLVN